MKSCPRGSTCPANDDRFMVASPGKWPPHWDIVLRGDEAIFAPERPAPNRDLHDVAHAYSPDRSTLRGRQRWDEFYVVGFQDPERHGDDRTRSLEVLPF